MNIPVELFLGFFSVSIVMALIGLIRNPQIPATIVIAGIFILSMSVLTTGIIMGKIPTTSNTSGSTTTYTFVDNVFTFTKMHKVLFALIGSIFMLIGSSMVIRND